MKIKFLGGVDYLENDLEIGKIYELEDLSYTDFSITDNEMSYVLILKDFKYFKEIKNENDE